MRGYPAWRSTVLMSVSATFICGFNPPLSGVSICGSIGSTVGLELTSPPAPSEATGSFGKSSSWSATIYMASSVSSPIPFSVSIVTFASQSFNPLTEVNGLGFLILNTPFVAWRLESLGFPCLFDCESFILPILQSYRPLV